MGRLSLAIGLARSLSDVSFGGGGSKTHYNTMSSNAECVVLHALEKRCRFCVGLCHSFVVLQGAASTVLHLSVAHIALMRGQKLVARSDAQY